MNGTRRHLLLKEEDYTFDLVNISCLPSSTDYNAIVRLGQEISPAMPYLNSILRGGHYAHREKIFDFMHHGHIVSMTPREIRVTGLSDRAQARLLIEELREIINSVWARREEILPCFENLHRPSALEVLKQLPRNNCGECGLPTCLAFAITLIADPEKIAKCPGLADPSYAERLEGLVLLLQ